MNTSTSCELQRQSLRLRLQANRLLLTQSIPSQAEHDADNFPRSYTMRILTNTPGIGNFLVSEVAPFLIGKYLEKRRRRI